MDGKEKFITRDFYSSSSELYEYSNGRISVCKSCIQDRYNKLLTVHEGKSVDAFKLTCMLFDVYFDEGLYNECVIKNGTSFLGEYFRLVNSTKDRRDKSGLNNTLEGTEGKDIALDDGGVVNEKLIVEWGSGRNKNDYLMLEKRYKELAERFPSKTPEEQYIIKDICKLELDIDNCRRTGKTEKIASLENVKAKKMKDLDIIPADKKNSINENAVRTFSMRLKLYETDKPVPGVLDELKDTNGVNDYWERTVVKPMAKMQGYAVGDYSLENGMDEIEYTDEYLKALKDVENDE